MHIYIYVYLSHFGITVGCGILPPFYNSFGPSGTRFMEGVGRALWAPSDRDSLSLGVTS